MTAYMKNIVRSDAGFPMRSMRPFVRGGMQK